MMERLDAIAVLQGMHKKEFSLQTFAESNGNYTAEWYHSERAEALQVAISILEMLNQNKCKAEDAVKALQICFGPGTWEEICPKCSYYDSAIPCSAEDLALRNQDMDPGTAAADAVALTMAIKALQAPARRRMPIWACVLWCVAAAAIGAACVIYCL